MMMMIVGDVNDDTHRICSVAFAFLEGRVNKNKDDVGWHVSKNEPPVQCATKSFQSQMRRITPTNLTQTNDNVFLTLPGSVELSTAWLTKVPQFIFLLLTHS